LEQRPACRETARAPKQTKKRRTVGQRHVDRGDGRVLHRVDDRVHDGGQQRGERERERGHPLQQQLGQRPFVQRRARRGQARVRRREGGGRHGGVDSNWAGHMSE
jgi:hypothetical protein